METASKPKGVFREVWERVKRFALPEEAFSLKLVFDNVRNYLICAAVIGAVGALSPKSAGGQPIWPASILVMAFLLIGANFLQSWLLVDRLTSGVGGFQKQVRPKWGRFRRRLLRSLLVILLLPVVVSAFDLFQLMIQWAVSGGRPGGGGL